MGFDVQRNPFEAVGITEVGINCCVELNMISITKHEFRGRDFWVRESILWSEVEGNIVGKHLQIKLGMSCKGQS